ncbi:pyruvate kinase [Methylocystis bryophila]|uniref:Pyruvate kinase n=1 Tax=Methylocystis bryophila TaxID=655015 RepID=A0A1W6MTD7_9HYPH|nr:pyruvate kinase [Methylocystis bryophila]ARN80858.1 pyruvate kinase [Methylocystis bryophila]BDV40946.1 pyruvate kinase [Methylocystis bryophila]
MSHRQSPARDDDDDLQRLLAETTALREDIERRSPGLLAAWEASGEAAANLADYLILRQHDLAALQSRLASYGLSSLGRSEARTRNALDALIATLKRLCGGPHAPYPSAQAMAAGHDALLAQCDVIFGPPRPGPHTRIMATLPSEAATDPSLVKRLVAAGMDCARINCAHDDATAWATMIANVRAAEQELGVGCRVLMDVAGPKCRVEKLRCAKKYRAHKGDRLKLLQNLDAEPNGAIAIEPSFPEIVNLLEPGAEVWIDDGKIGAKVVARSEGAAELAIFSARLKGVRLKLEKGLNFPSTELDLSPLTPKDIVDLDFVAQHADLVGYSFVQRVSDVELLQDHLASRRGDAPPQPLILKIETPLAVRNLPQLIIQSAKRHPTAVMIARGDLAVELGFARLSEIQEELLWLCEAAHAPVIWATQVLDQYVKEGVFSRAETTDAAMAQRADCVMLNKGPHVVDAVALLRDILTRMDRHHIKKFARFARLSAWG